MKYFSKGDEAYCLGCHDHLFTISRDVFKGEKVDETMLTGGQNFKFREKMACKKCFKDFYLDKSHLEVINAN